jgi:glyoxylase-like metal-dependent hydrolase (beta-lactamase superfamily II)
VGAVGRPDLFDNVRQGAMDLYHSLQQQILTLPDSLELYPGHFSGSVCGKGMSGKPMSSLGFEKRFNPLLSAISEDAFVSLITKTVLPEPSQKAETIRLNKGV